MDPFAQRFGGAALDEGRVPSLEGAIAWLNTPPLTPGGLARRVVVVDFCFHTGINWLRTLPHVRGWAERHMPTTMVLVHGAFAESSSWNVVAGRLIDEGSPVYQRPFCWPRSTAPLSDHGTSLLLVAAAEERQQKQEHVEDIEEDRGGEQWGRPDVVRAP